MNKKAFFVVLSLAACLGGIAIYYYSCVKHIRSQFPGGLKTTSDILRVKKGRKYIKLTRN